MKGPEFAYIDETGDIGRGPGGSLTYSLGCVLVPMSTWTDSLDALVQMRRGIKATYGVRMNVEVKANHLVGIKKIYRDLGLGDGQVRDIYERHLDAATTACSGAMEIVINKSKITSPSLDVFDTSWEYLFTRLRKRSEKYGHPIVLVHDKGEEERVRRHLRKFRRVNWQGSGIGSARLLIEDAVPRDSEQSYFIQLADLVAYAGSRCAVPANGKVTRICDDTMWGRLKPIQVAEVNRRRGDGIYLWP